MNLECKRAKAMLEEIKELRERRKNAFSAYNAYTGSHKEELNKMSAAAAIESEAYETECERIIRSIEDVLLQKVLHLRYFENKTIAEIAAELFYTKNYIYGKHRAALEEFAARMDEND